MKQYDGREIRIYTFLILAQQEAEWSEVLWTRRNTAMKHVSVSQISECLPQIKGILFVNRFAGLYKPDSPITDKLPN
jgi:hypothetical protein